MGTITLEEFGALLEKVERIVESYDVRSLDHVESARTLGEVLGVVRFYHDWYVTGP